MNEEQFKDTFIATFLATLAMRRFDGGFISGSGYGMEENAIRAAREAASRAWKIIKNGGAE
jgi:hypothetical protein